MNFRRINDNALADMAVNMRDLLMGTELSAIDVNVRTRLIAALGTMPADLQSHTYRAEVLEDERMAEVTEKNAVHNAIEAWMMQVRDVLKGSLAPKEQYDLCGLRFPPPPVTIYVAVDPTDLSVTGFSNDTNKCRFAGNNKYGHVVYEIWRRRSGDDWGVLALTKKQTFLDTPVRPGDLYEYKVRAVATKTVSNFSNTAVVYPAVALNL